MHYHVYVGPKTESMPKDIFSFSSGQDAIEKVMELLEKLGVADGTVDMSHTENDLGRFSVILVPELQYKVVLHECECANVHDQNKSINLKPKILN